MAKHVLKGSDRQPVPGAKSVGKANSAERLEVSLILRCPGHDSLAARVKELSSGNDLQDCLSHEDFASQFGADSADIAAVRTFAGAHGLTVVQEDAARRTVVLSGTVAQYNQAFAVDLQQFHHADGSYRGHTGPVHLPDELVDIVIAVLGLDNRPQARPHFRSRPSKPEYGGELSRSRTGIRPAAADDSISFTPLELASLYHFPVGTGQGQCIGLIELGGGYRNEDLSAYFATLGLAPPKISTVSVDHGRNDPSGQAQGPDGEVMLDIEIVGALAPDAHIVVYFAPNTDAGFLDAVTTAIHDTTNKPSVISISWGGPESAWTQQSLSAFDNAFQAAATLGITITAAAGDSGSDDGVGDNADHVDFPASSAFVLGCGGTSLQAAAGRITKESVWNDGAANGATGGGVSAVFATPPYQKDLKVTGQGGSSRPLGMRGVPDIAGVADPRTGYAVRVDGTDVISGGTSAVAPLWAALITRLNAARGKPLGYLHPLLYRNPAALNDIVAGNNGDYAAGPGWDACTGLGSPNGAALAAALATGATSIA